MDFLRDDLTHLFDDQGIDQLSLEQHSNINVSLAVHCK